MSSLTNNSAILQPPMQPVRPHFNVLDSWRGICACMVALAHFNVYNHIYDLPVFWNAGFYVDFFFVLSGFVIFANYQEKLVHGFSVGKFVLIRFGRLYPLHILTLGLFICHELLQMLLPSAGGISSFKPFSSPGEGPVDILMNVLLLNSFDTIGVYSLNSPSWSISAEFYTYILFAILIAKFSQYQKLWAPLICVAGIIFFAFYEGKFMTHDWGIFRCIYQFCVGGLCWMAWNKYGQKVSALISGKVVWSMLELASIMLVLYLVSTAGKTVLVGFTPFIFAALIYIFSFEKGFVSSVLQRKFFLLLGALSYSIYMLHALIAWKGIEPVVDIYYHFYDVPITTVINGDRKLGLERWQGDIVSVVYLAGVIFASYLSYRFFEVPCRDYFKRKAKQLFPN